MWTLQRLAVLGCQSLVHMSKDWLQAGSHTRQLRRDIVRHDVAASYASQLCTCTWHLACTLDTACKVSASLLRQLDVRKPAVQSGCSYAEWCPLKCYRTALKDLWISPGRASWLQAVPQRCGQQALRAVHSKGTGDFAKVLH